MSSFFAINDFYIINPASIDFLLDRILVKGPRSSYVTLFFLKKIFVAVSVPPDNTLKISKLLLFQLKESEFSAIELLGAIIDF